MQSAYTARKYSDMLHTGGAHITSNPVWYVLHDDAEYERINKKVIPSIMNEVYKLLMTGETSIDVFHEVKK